MAQAMAKGIVSAGRIGDVVSTVENSERFYAINYLSEISSCCFIAYSFSLIRIDKE